MKELEKKYIFKDAETKWQKYWQDNNIYHFNWEEKNQKSTFAIDTPPPHVSGVLHMGHIFGYTQMDSIARFQRMNGKNVFFPIGYDDNGLPSERYVEKKINRKSKSMSRIEFVNICDNEIGGAEDLMRELFISAGFSFDFTAEYRTISPMSRKLSQSSFIDLYKKGHIYQKEEAVIWDVVDQTALAQTELEDLEMQSQMNYLKFSLIDEKTMCEEDLEIMTTRPELLPACVAIFCHPDDFEKYKNKKVITPLNKIVPILADESVEKDKGTGVMMCCTFGDQADVEKWKKYGLDLKTILNESGCLKLEGLELEEGYLEGLNGLFVEKARNKILDILEKEKKITRKPVIIVHTVKVGERSKYPVEILIKKQWFVDVLSIKEQLHEQAKKCRWKPEYMEERIHSWIDGLSWDWCISRQRFFGVPVPVWYSNRDGEKGKVILPNIKKLPVDPINDLPDGYNYHEVVAETDVLDTWATSAISPQLSTHFINENFGFDKNVDSISLPFDLRFQGHDIIRTWAFCTIVKAYYHENKIPWKNVLINGHCLAEDGKKMSKSLGNVIDPVKIIKEYGSDALRYWTINSNLGADTNFSFETIKAGQKLITKLFNASKFAELHFKNLKNNEFDFKKDLEKKVIFKTTDLWLITKLKKLVDEYTRSFENFDFTKCLALTEDFFWNNFCDNYLEIVKIRCYGVEGTKYYTNIPLSQKERENIRKEQESAIKTIYYVLNVLLKLFAPFMPAITEELFYHLYNEEFIHLNSIHSRNSFGNIFNFVEDSSSEKVGDEMLKVIADIRKYKSEKNISIKEIIANVNLYSECDMMDVLEDLKNVCNVNNFFVVNSEEYKLEIK